MKRGSNRAKGRYLQNYRGSGCDVGGRIVAPDARDPRMNPFIRKLFTTYQLYYILFLKRRKKRPGIAQLKTEKSLTFVPCGSVY